MITLEAIIDHISEHWGCICQATIPECWEVTCVNINEVMDAEHWDHYQLYSTGKSREGAIESFKSRAEKMFPKGRKIKFIIK